MCVCEILIFNFSVNQNVFIHRKLALSHWIAHFKQFFVVCFCVDVLNISQAVEFIFGKGQTKQTDKRCVIFYSSEALIPHCHTRNLAVLLIRFTFYNTTEQCLDTCKFINYMRQYFSINLLKFIEPIL